MSDIDMIPVDYRTWLDQQTLMRKTLVLFAIVNIAVLGASSLLSQIAAKTQQRIVVLQSENAVTQQQQQQLQQLENQQTEYERQWTLLRGLRAGAEIDDMFSMIDRSLRSRDLWFLDWSFRRAGVIVDGELRGVETGYFIIVADNADAFQKADLEVETHMTIRGQAIDHQALSTFVRALFDQDDIKDVNVQKTSLTEYANGRVVEFDMTVVLKSALRDS